MNNSPTDIYATIIEHFISAHAEPMPKDPNEVKFIPRGYLTPLLRVSKRWYANSVKYLYRSIAVGSHRRLRGEEIAKALHKTLKANSQIAALVEQLQLGILNDNFSNNRRKWAQTNTGILLLCPNVKHVEIRGSELCEFDALVSVLEEKSLVSFSITSQYLSNTAPNEGGRISLIFDLMQSWPKLRSIHVEGFYEDAEWMTLDMSQISGCCPDLREIGITNVFLRPISYKALRAMCSSGVTKLSVWVKDFSGKSATHELCECLRVWSATLECLRIVSYHNESYPPLSESIATLTELRVLEFNGLRLDYDAISNLPRLERIYCFTKWKHEEWLQQLSTLLKDSEKFPSLAHIAGSSHSGLHNPALTYELRNICGRRDIQIGYDNTDFFI